MTLTTIAGLNTALPGQRKDGCKTFTPAAGFWRSTWLDAGAPGTGVAPSSSIAGDVPTSATLGAFPFTNPSSGITQIGRLLAGLNVNGSSAGCVLALYDRLLQTGNSSGISATSTSAQTINSTALTRPDANGNQAEAWYEVYVVMGAGTPTVTLTYTNPAGTASRTGSSGALPTTMPVGRTGQFSMQSGDDGVKSVQTWQSSATFTSGTIGLVLRRLIAFVPLFGGHSVTQVDGLGLALPRVYDDACIETLIFATSANQHQDPFTVHLVNG